MLRQANIDNGAECQFTGLHCIKVQCMLDSMTKCVLVRVGGVAKSGHGTRPTKCVALYTGPLKTNKVC